MQVYRERDLHRIEKSEDGTFYLVDMKRNSCSCPQYRYRSQKQGSDCKHLEYLKARPEEADRCVDFVVENSFVASDELKDAFGSHLVVDLISACELIVEDRKIRRARINH